MDAPRAVALGTFCAQHGEPAAAPADPLEQQKHSLDLLTEEYDFLTSSYVPICHVQDEHPD